MIIGDLVYRRSVSVPSHHSVPSKFYGLGLILRHLWKINGTSYYSVYWFRLKKSMNVTEELLFNPEESKVFTKKQLTLWENESE